MDEWRIKAGVTRWWYQDSKGFEVGSGQKTVWHLGRNGLGIVRDDNCASTAPKRCSEQVTMIVFQPSEESLMAMVPEEPIRESIVGEGEV